MKNFFLLACVAAILCFSCGDEDSGGTSRTSGTSSTSSLVDQAMLQGSWKLQSFRIKNGQTYKETEVPMNKCLEAQIIKVQEKNMYAKIATSYTFSCSYKESSGSYTFNGDKLTFIGKDSSKENELEIKRITDNSIGLKMVIDGSTSISRWIKE